MTTKSSRDISLDLNGLKQALEQIDAKMLKCEKQFAPFIQKVSPSNKKNAANLLHYLALRSLDIRELQIKLHEAGLSSLASSESHIRGQLLAVLQRLGDKKPIPNAVFDYQGSKASLQQKTTALFGARQNEQVPYLMVTFDGEYADNFDKVKKLMESGMNVARINCAHDDDKTWLRMIQHIKQASEITGLGCKIYMDLAGPKIRTTLYGKDKLKVQEGQLIYLTDEAHLKKKAKNTVGCTIPNIAAQLNIGDIVLFDDGLIETQVESIEKKKATLHILRISSKKPFIKKEKGINFPNSNLLLPALTEQDTQCLPFVLEHADMVGYSFVRSNKDILKLKEAMGDKKKPLILKIETLEAINNLPNLLLCGMEEANVGVMIARGDLAVEIGFERMSEIQEEILWICEAAHVPSIWATQVLENLNKSGVATRAEITDAAYSASADCVMINKGQHTIQVLKTLKDVLLRSGGHRMKKRFTFRPLTIATRFMNG